MIETIQELCYALAQVTLSVDHVASVVGPIVTQNGAVVLQPHDSAFSEAIVEIEDGEMTPSVVKLFVAEGQELRLSNLRASLRQPDEESAVVAPCRPNKVMFYVDYPDRDMICGVIASLVFDAEHNDGLVQCISIKRDVVLE